MKVSTGPHVPAAPAAYYHRSDETWLRTSTGEKRGYIDTDRLRELWFHMGTVCNLRCPSLLKVAVQVAEPLLNEGGE